MKLGVLFAAIGSAAVFAACGDNATPADLPGLTIPGPSGAGLSTIRYTTRPDTETAQTRGKCSAGYMEVKPPPSPPRPLPCVYDGDSAHGIQARIGVGYPFQVGMPCFVYLVQFDGRLFASESALNGKELEPSNGFGTMTLVARDLARFVAQDGAVVTFHAVSFVRQPLCG